MARQPDIIAAVATAPGRGGIGVVRVSGPHLAGFATALTGQTVKPRHAGFVRFRDAHGQALDEGLLLYFPAPRSFTGEDVLELQGHGGPVVMRLLLQRCVELGARLAEPGEFSKRAFLNGKLDLAQAEAIADLIEASTASAARSAVRSLSGEFSQRVNALRDELIDLRMLVEATLDFPEEEIEFLQTYQAAAKLAGIAARLDAIIGQARQGMILREGLHVVLAGQPNVGKSSLLNALAGDDIAIVTPIAGTTRDRVVQQIHLDGVPLHIVDTAGLRDTDDTVERIGIERTWAEIGKADVILHLQDARNPADTLDAAITQRLPAGTPVLTVLNKVDLVADNAALPSVASAMSPNEAPGDRLEAAVPQDTIRPPRVDCASAQAASHPSPHPDTLRISARTGAGLDALRTRLLGIAGWVPGAESPWLARERHLQALSAARQHLATAAAHAAQNDQVLDLFAEELRLAHQELMAITGEFSSDDLLGEIFSRFCIGK